MTSQFPALSERGVPRNLSTSDPLLTPVILAELLDAAAWAPVLETYARTIKVAVALTDPNGRSLGVCQNPQEAWLFARAGGAQPRSSDCLFCLVPETPCAAVVHAIESCQVTIVHDLTGMAHVAVPLRLGDRAVGAIIAGQVFDRYPEQFSLRRAAKTMNVSAQQLWRIANQQPPIRRSTLLVYGELLAALGCAFLRDRYANILDRRLTQANRRYQALIDGVEEYGFFSVDASRTVTSWNSGAERLFGFTEFEMVGTNCSTLFALEGADTVLNRELNDTEREGFVHLTGWKLRKDGARFFSESTLAPLGNGTPREFGVLVHDVTERRNAEAALLQSHKLESIGVLASGIAHDFNNLLTGILGGLSCARGMLPSDHAITPLLKLAEQSSEKAAALTHQLLAYAGKGQFVITQFDLSSEIQELLPLIATSIPKSVEVRLNLMSGLPLVEADISQIEQVIMNLVINGAEAIGPEGGVIQVSTGVTTSGDTPADEVFMEIADSGSGMDDALKARIFDPFFTTKFTGRGLGLSAVSGIIRAHHGRMTVDSSPGEGTAFRVFFPALPRTAPEEDEVVSSTLVPAARRILIVEDESLLRELAEAILSRIGYQILTAENGRKALDIFIPNPNTFAAIILDMTMPVMGGKETLRRIREIDSTVPVVIATGYSEDATREELESGEAVAFIQKPYNAERLTAKVWEVLTKANVLAAGGNG